MGYFFKLSVKPGVAGLLAAPCITHLAILHFSNSCMECMTNISLRGAALPILLEGDVTDCCRSTLAVEELAK